VPYILSQLEVRDGDGDDYTIETLKKKLSFQMLEDLSFYSI